MRLEVGHSGLAWWFQETTITQAPSLFLLTSNLVIASWNRWWLEVQPSHLPSRLGDGLEGLISLLAKASSSKQPSQRSLPDLERTFHWPEIEHKATCSYREVGKHALWAGLSAAWNEARVLGLREKGSRTLGGSSLHCPLGILSTFDYRWLFSQSTVQNLWLFSFNLQRNVSHLPVPYMYILLS